MIDPCYGCYRGLKYGRSYCHAVAIQETCGQTRESIIQEIASRQADLLRGFVAEHERLVSALLEALATCGTQQVSPELPDTGEPFLTPLERTEKQTIIQYLEKNGWNQARTSGEIGIRPNTLIVKMRKYSISSPNRKEKRRRKVPRLRTVLTVADTKGSPKENDPIKTPSSLAT